LALAKWRGAISAGVPALGYVQPDHLGTPRVIIDATRNVPVWEWNLAGEAFGADQANEDPDGDGVPFGFALRFPGQQATPESGLNYNYQRDYDAGVGRYVQSDPIGLAAGTSTYAYAGGDPVSAIDPLGLIGYVCKKGNNIGIAIPINFQGATQAQIAQITIAIQRAWSGTFDSYNVKTTVQSIPIWHIETTNGISVSVADKASSVQLPHMNEGNWYLPGQWGDATFAHEAGHLLGLGDYGPGIMGKDLSVPVNEQNINEILKAGNEAIRHGCGCN